MQWAGDVVGTTKRLKNRRLAYPLSGPRGVFDEQRFGEHGCAANTHEFGSDRSQRSKLTWPRRVRFCRELSERTLRLYT